MPGSFLLQIFTCGGCLIRVARVVPLLIVHVCGPTSNMYGVDGSSTIVAELPPEPNVEFKNLMVFVWIVVSADTTDVLSAPYDP